MTRCQLFLASLLAWFLPFAISVPLVDAGCIPGIPRRLFKKIMVVVGMAMGTGYGSWFGYWPMPTKGDMAE